MEKKLNKRPETATKYVQYILTITKNQLCKNDNESLQIAFTFIHVYYVYFVLFLIRLNKKKKQ